MSILKDNRILGEKIAFRLISPNDADYVFGLRTNPLLNRHLSEVSGTAEDQRRWIGTYQEREAAGREYYFIIELRSGRPCGTVRLYHIEADHFTWGSWILDENKPRKAALDSAMLVYTIAFDHLGLREARFDVRKENENTIAFHRRFGATETHQSMHDVFFVYPRSRFEVDRTRFLAVLKEDAP